MHVRGDVRVVADDDQNGRRPVLTGGRVSHLLELLLPLAGQREDRVLHLPVERFGFWPSAGEPFARAQVPRDVTPEPEVLRVRPPGVIDGRQAGNLRDPALDGVDQAEVAHDPGERRALGVAAALDVERCGGEIDAQLDAASGVDRIESVDPDGRFLAVRLGVRRDSDVLSDRRRPIGVVPLVVQDQQRLVVPQVAQPVARERLGSLPAEPAHRHLADRHLLAFRAEPVPVGHQHLPLGQFRTERGRHEIERLVVVVRVARSQHAEPVLDRQVGAHDQRASRVPRIAGLRAAVAERPGDEHRHDDRLAAAGRHLARVAESASRRSAPTRRPASGAAPPSPPTGRAAGSRPCSAGRTPRDRAGGSSAVFARGPVVRADR